MLPLLEKLRTGQSLESDFDEEWGIDQTQEPLTVDGEIHSRSRPLMRGQGARGKTSLLHHVIYGCFYCQVCSSHRIARHCSSSRALHSSYVKTHRPSLLFWWFALSPTLQNPGPFLPRCSEAEIVPLVRICKQHQQLPGPTVWSTEAADSK